MLTKEQFHALSTKLRQGLDLSYAQMLEQKRRNGQPLILGTPDGKIIEVEAKKLQEKQK